jgi:hypothetical protein
MTARRINYNRAVDLMRTGSILIKQHNKDGTMGHYLAPGGYVEPAIADKLKEHPLVLVGRDGIWPGHDQTWKFGAKHPEKPQGWGLP